MGEPTKEADKSIELEKLEVEFVTVKQWDKGGVKGQYEGFVKGENRHGYGKFTDEQNGSYVGGWKDDKQEGYGVFTLPDGSTDYEGGWQAGERAGHGFQKLSG